MESTWVRCMREPQYSTQLPLVGSLPASPAILLGFNGGERSKRRPTCSVSAYAGALNSAALVVYSLIFSMRL